MEAVETTDQEELQRLYDSLNAEAMKNEDAGTVAKNEDEITLDRYLRIHGRLTSERDRLKEQMAKMLTDLDGRIDRLDFVYEPIVREIVQKMLAGGKSKSLHRPFGTVGFRTVPPKLEVEDAAAVAEAIIAGAIPESCQRVKIEYSQSGLTEHFKSTGELPPGCKLLESFEKFYAKHK